MSDTLHGLFPVASSGAASRSGSSSENSSGTILSLRGGATGPDGSVGSAEAAGDSRQELPFALALEKARAGQSDSSGEMPAQSERVRDTMVQAEPEVSSVRQKTDTVALVDAENGFDHQLNGNEPRQSEASDDAPVEIDRLLSPDTTERSSITEQGRPSAPMVVPAQVSPEEALPGSLLEADPQPGQAGNPAVSAEADAVEGSGPATSQAGLPTDQSSARTSTQGSVEQITADLPRDVRASADATPAASDRTVGESVSAPESLVRSRSLFGSELQQGSAATRTVVDNVAVVKTPASPVTGSTEIPARDNESILTEEGDMTPPAQASTPVNGATQGLRAGVLASEGQAANFTRDLSAAAVLQANGTAVDSASRVPSTDAALLHQSADQSVAAAQVVMPSSQLSRLRQSLAPVVTGTQNADAGNVSIDGLSLAAAQSDSSAKVARADAVPTGALSASLNPGTMSEAVSVANADGSMVSEMENTGLQPGLLQDLQRQRATLTESSSVQGNSITADTLLRSQGTDNMFLSAANGTVTAPVMPRSEGISVTPLNAPLNVALSTDDAEIALADNVKWMAKEGVQTATVNVTPAGMGPITVKVGIEQDQMSVSIVASQQTTREALDSMLPRLRDQLASQGHESVKLDVSDGRGEQSRGGNGQMFAGARQFSDMWSQGEHRGSGNDGEQYGSTRSEPGIDGADALVAEDLQQAGSGFTGGSNRSSAFDAYV